MSETWDVETMELQLRLTYGLICTTRLTALALRLARIGTAFMSVAMRARTAILTALGSKPARFANIAV